MAHILVFDDELIDRQDWLVAEGARFTYLPHADAAEDQVATLKADIVFMDYSMGARHRSGVEAVSALRERFPSNELPIIGISSDARMNAFMVMAGANAGVVKMALPGEIKELIGLFDTSL